MSILQGEPPYQVPRTRLDIHFLLQKPFHRAAFYRFGILCCSKLISFPSIETFFKWQFYFLLAPPLFKKYFFRRNYFGLPLALPLHFGLLLLGHNPHDIATSLAILIFHLLFNFSIKLYQSFPTILRSFVRYNYFRNTV